MTPTPAAFPSCAQAFPEQPADPATGPVVRLAAGRVQGRRQGPVDAFLGLPYAAPPVGPRRWRAPQPLAPWAGVRPAQALAPDPVQVPFDGDLAPLAGPMSEDALFLNVWCPAGAAGGASGAAGEGSATGPGRPVLVWIHGGGFVIGGSSPAVYDGAALAAQGLVVVSLNYRLGHFGFFACPALSAEARAAGTPEAQANFAHLDQIAALQWVQQHVAAFGGDPGCVTLMGESAGGGSVRGLMGSPLARGLFHRVVVMSGGGRGLLDGDRRLAESRPGLPSAHELGVQQARHWGITGADDDSGAPDGPGARALAALRALPAGTVLDGLGLMDLHGPGRRAFSGQTLDGRVLLEEPEGLADWIPGGVPTLIGTTRSEIGNAQAADQATAWALFGADAEAARAAYDPEGTATLAQVNSRIGQDHKMHEPARHLADRLAARGAPCHLYRFSHVAACRRQDWPDGAPHASEIPYWLGTLAAAFGAAVTPQDQAVSRCVQQALLHFAATGDPRAPQDPVLAAWAPHQPGDGRVFDIGFTVGIDGDVPAAMLDDPLRARLDLVAVRQAALAG